MGPTLILPHFLCYMCGEGRWISLDLLYVPTSIPFSQILIRRCHAVPTQDDFQVCFNSQHVDPTESRWGAAAPLAEEVGGPEGSVQTWRDSLLVEAQEAQQEGGS